MSWLDECYCSDNESLSYCRYVSGWGGGGPGPNDRKKLLTRFKSSIFLFKENYFSKMLGGGVNIFKGSNFFQGGPISYSYKKPIKFVVFWGGGPETLPPPPFRSVHGTHEPSAYGQLVSKL